MPSFRGTLQEEEEEQLVVAGSAFEHRHHHLSRVESACLPTADRLGGGGFWGVS